MLIQQRGRPSFALILLIAAVVVLIGWWLMSKTSSVIWKTETVQRADIEATVAAIGTLRPRESVEVGAQVSGQITRLHVDVGDVVEQGQLLVEIDPAILQTTVDAGRAQLAALAADQADQEARYELAELRYRRQQQMAQDKATSEEDLQVAAAELKSAKAGLARLKAQIEQVASNLKGNEAQLGYTRIYAPIAGTVINVDAKQGQTLNATYQTPTVLRIADLTQMTVWTNVSEADIRRIAVGMEARFTSLAGDGRRWSGQVRQILPAPPVVSGQTEAQAATTVVQYPVLFDVDNPDGELRPQMTAQVSFITASANNVLTLPLAALSASADVNQQYDVMFLNEQQKTETRRVRIGARDRQLAEILDGAQEGERVVTGESVAADGGRRLFQW